MTDTAFSRPPLDRLNDIGARHDLAEQFPEHLRTRFTEVELMCPKCRSEWSPGVAMLINAKTDPAATEGILRGTMHRSRCPACKGYVHDIMHIWDYYDPDNDQIVQVRMDWEYKAGGGEEVYFKRLEDLVMKYQNDDVKVDVVFGMQELIDKYLGGEEAVEAAMRRRDKEVELKLYPGNIRADNEAEYFDEAETGTA
ncbi:MAG: CpXC domain-containing protein [Thermomicrobiales bacterium]